MGNLTNNSREEERKVAIEKVVGVRTWSMPRRDRRMRGVACVNRGTVMLCRMVGMYNVAGQKREGNCLNVCSRPRFLLVVVDVMISLWTVSIYHAIRIEWSYFVRTISSGARITPANAAAATATPSDVHGYMESTTSTAGPRPTTAPGSGTLARAARKLRDQLSTERSSMLYTKVAFEPFQTPHIPSLVHS